jgi:hypothetical protein
MNAIYSLCTKTPHFVFYEGHLLLATFSILEAKRNFGRVKFYGDATALTVAGALDWKIDDCEEMKTKGWPLATWAFGKLHAISREALANDPFVHLDLDVVVQTPIALFKPLIAQSIDHHHYYNSATMRLLMKRLKIPDNAIAYNCGLVGGSDLQFLYHWAIEGMEKAKELDAPLVEGTAASMLVEQYLFGLRARRAGLRVQEVLRYPPESHALDCPGYHHFVGKSKSLPETRAKVLAKMQERYPAELKAFNQGVTKLRETYKVR